MTSFGIRQTRELLLRGESSVLDQVMSSLTSIREVDGDLRAFVSVAGDEAMRQAEAADDRIRGLGPAAWRQQPLLGITVSVKDLIQTRDLPTTRGSLAPNHRPRVDAPAVARLRAAGAIVIGKTSTSEYGWSASTVSRVTTPTRNPWHRERSAGGSSGGAAAAVSAGLCAVALGTDGAGSVRIPAAFCGVVGFKPSFGLVPYVPPGAERLAHIGALASSVRDIAELMTVLAGPHQGDPDSIAGRLAPPREIPPLRIGWLEFPKTATEVGEATVRAGPVLSSHGHRLERLDVPFPDPYPALVEILAVAEAANTTPAHEELCDSDRLAIVHYGRKVSGTALMRAEQLRLALRATLESVMERYDLLLMPTVPIEPFDVDAIAPPWAADPRDLLWLAWSPTSYPFNLTGQPALSLPVGLTNSGLPVGLQLVGPLGGDDLVLSVAGQLEAGLDPLPAPPERLAKGLV